MEPADEETLRFYGANAPAYAEREITSRRIRLGRFLALLAPGAAILELGCGAGADTAEMLARGFDVSPTDGAPEMAEVASRRLGRPVGTLLFHDLDAVEAYDGVWAKPASRSPRRACAGPQADLARAETGQRFLRQLQDRRRRRPRHAQPLLQISVAEVVALNLRQRGQLDFA